MNHFFKAIYMYFFFKGGLTLLLHRHNIIASAGKAHTTRKALQERGLYSREKNSEIEGIGVILSCTATILFCTPE